MSTALTSSELEAVGVHGDRRSGLARRSDDGLTERLLAESIRIEARGRRTGDHFGRIAMKNEIDAALIAAGMLEASRLVQAMPARVAS